MSTKKTLYRPAPELLEHSTANLIQGSSSTTRTIKIKQGVLGPGTRTAGSKRLTSTKKSTKSFVSERRNPVVVCHDPRLVHSQIKCSGNLENVTANTTTSPTVVIINKDSNNDKSMVKKPVHKAGQYHVKSKYKTGTRTATNVSAVNKSTVNPSRCSSLNASGSLHVEKPQKTSTPSWKHHKDWSCNESAIAKHDTTLTVSHEEKDLGNSYLVPSSRGDADDIQIVYCRYLLAKHLQLLAASNQKKKAEQAISHLSFLHDKNNKLEQELATLEDEVSELQQLHNLQCQLQQQKHSLAPSIDKLEHALDQYHVLCKNLDTTTHHMPLIDIHNPDAGEMEQALDESRIHIGQINILLKSKVPQIHQAAEAMKKLSQTCEQEATSIPRVQNCADDMTSLVMEFGSLVAQLSSHNP